jgi:hypothetical protein
MTISNWNGSVHFTPEKIEAPTSLERLIEIVKDTVTFPGPLRAIGELHSLNEAAATGGTAIFMRHFDKIGEPEGSSGRQTIRVGAGVRMIDLKEALKRHGLQLEVVPEIGNATAGSVACCGTKDSSLGPRGLGQISSCVVGVRMILADGRDEPIVDPDRLRIIRSSYGLLGIIHEVTFALKPRTKVRYKYKRVKLGDWLAVGQPLPAPASRDILGPKAHGFLGFLIPRKRVLFVERRTIARFQGALPGFDWLKLQLRTIAWMTGARPFAGLLRFLPRRLQHRISTAWSQLLEGGLLDFFFVRLLGRFSTFRADAMIDFTRPAPSYFEFTFWAFPASRWAEIVPKFFDFWDAFERRTGFRPRLPVEVYFIRQDPNAILSFSAVEDIFTLDLVNWTDEEPPLWKQMNEEFNEFAARHGGRPLLNQTKHLSPAVAERLWKQTRGWQQLSDTRDALDRNERFLTPFFKERLPKPTP